MEDKRQRAREFVDDSTEDTRELAAQAGLVDTIGLEVVEGPRTGLSWSSKGDRSSIGAHPSNDLVVEDPTVSGFHCEISIEPRGARVRDLDSRNGVFLDGTLVAHAFLRDGSLLRLGRSTLRAHFGVGKNVIPLSKQNRFGLLVGASATMRAVFAVLERAAESTATVLVEGETGTGKEGVAEAIHQASDRRDRPFVVVDCSAVAGELLDSDLFGHERGAFTGADSTRIGAFEQAHGGTLFLDEIGEFPLDLQPKLLRVLEQREVRRLGGQTVRPVDLRVIAATNRDLRAEVNQERFRADLYFRLAVLKVRMPPLRSRPEDIEVLAGVLLESLGCSPEDVAALCTPTFIARLRRSTWPGNVRELRNYLQRSLVFDDPPAPDERPAFDAPSEVDSRLTYEEARNLALAGFERRYVEGLLTLHQGNVARAARAGDIARAYLYKLIHKHGVKGR